MLNTPLISVIVPVFGIERYIGECIESIINQTYRNLEIILVDDGSTDRCPEICDLYSKKEERIKVIHKKNGGLVSARKAGLKMATGQYVGYVDGDDYLKPCFYESLLNTIGDADVVCAGFTRKLFDKKAKIKNLIPSGIYEDKELQRIKKKIISIGAFYTPGITTYLWNKLFKRSILEQYQFSISNDISIGEDAAVTYPLLINCSKIVISDNTDYVYRQREDSMLKTIRPFENELRGIQVLYKQLVNQFNGSNDVVKQINDYILSTCIMRSGGLTIHKQPLFPFSNSFKEKRIVVINAGTFGQQFVNRVRESNYCKIISWMDDDYWEYRRCCLDVDPIHLVNSGVDYVVIANISHYISLKIKQRLIKLGYSKESIVMVDVPNELKEELLMLYIQ